MTAHVFVCAGKAMCNTIFTRLRQILCATVVVASMLGCSNRPDSADNGYLRWVGDIKYDTEKDDVEFILCNGEEKVFQYFNFGNGLQYEGEKQAIKDRFLLEYSPVNTDQSGWIRIRFIVNCKGETGRFRLMGSDFDYQEMSFDKRISNQVLEIAKSLDGWVVQSMNEMPLDYYQYLIFKIKEGKIVEILP